MRSFVDVEEMDNLSLIMEFEENVKELATSGTNKDSELYSRYHDLQSEIVHRMTEGHEDEDDFELEEEEDDE